MQAAVYRGKEDVRAETIPVPQIGRGELLVRVESCGVCGTDLKKIQYATVAPPRVFGHEIAGSIAQVGAGVRGWKIGDRVVVYHHVACLRCHHCRNDQFTECSQFKKTGVTAGFEPAGGGFAQFARVMPWIVKGGGVIKIPKGVTDDEACLHEPVNTVLRAVKKLALRRGDWVVVFGQGSIGLMFTQICRVYGARVIAADLMESRLAVAKRLGAAAGVNATAADFVEQVRAIIRNPKSAQAGTPAPPAEKGGADAAVVAVPSARAIEQAFKVTRGGAKILLFAHTRHNDPVTMDAGAICVDERHVLGSYSSSPHLLKETSRLIFQRRINVRALITHRLPIAEIDTAIRLASNPTEDPLKIIIKPNSDCVTQ
jgi:L-iditol 2-dehydrogenase